MGLELAGKTFGGYRVGDVLESGPQGVLYAAEHSGSGDKVALKVYAADLARDKSLAARVVADVQRAVAVTHPNLATVREVGTAEYKGKRHLFVAMERLPGESLKSLLNKQKGQPLSLSRALHLGGEIAAALEAIHRSNQVHRHLHAGSVFVAPGDGERDEDRVLIFDLGAAAIPAGDDKKAKGGGKVQDDLRALAQLLYSMLGGGDSGADSNQAVLPLRLRNQAVPARIDAVLRSVLTDVLGTGDKAARYDSAAAFVAALYGSGETQPSYASWSADGRTMPKARKSGGTLLWAGVVAVAGGLALGYFLFPSDSPTTGKGPIMGNPPNPVVDRAAVNPSATTTLDAGTDAASALRPPGPGNWPSRSGGVIPPVRPADEWPAANTQAATAASAAKAPVSPATPAVNTPAPTSPAGTASVGATVAKSPQGTTAPGPAVPTSAPTAPGAAKPAAPTPPGVVPATSKPATVSPAAGVPTAPAAKPASSAGTSNPNPAVPAAKPAAPAPATGSNIAAPASKPAATPGGSPIPAPAAKPATVAPTGAAVPGSAVPASVSKPVSGANPSSTTTPAAKPSAVGPTASPTATAARPATGPAASTGAAPAKPAVAPGSTSATPGASAGPARSPSAPAAPAGAVPAAKNPEPRPSSPGSSAPTAKPAPNPGVAN